MDYSFIMIINIIDLTFMQFYVGHQLLSADIEPMVRARVCAPYAYLRIN